MLKSLGKLITYLVPLGLIRGTWFLIGKHFKTNKVISLPSVKHPILLRPGTSDEKVFFQVFVKKEYDFQLDFVPEVIIDGGANIGLSSIYFKNRFPNAKIIAIEPDNENFEILRANLEKYENIYLKKGGIWPKRSVGSLSNKYGFGKWGMIVEELNTNSSSSCEEIETFTIRDIMDEFKIDKIDLLKLDIESSEKQVFSENFMTWLPKTKAIVVEIHDWITPGCSKSFFKAINLAFNDYSFGQQGENTIIINRDLLD